MAFCDYDDKILLSKHWTNIGLEFVGILHLIPYCYVFLPSSHQKQVSSPGRDEKSNWWQEPNNFSDANRRCLVYLGGQKRRQNLVAHRPWKQPLKPQEVWWSEEAGQGSGGTAGSWSSGSSWCIWSIWPELALQFGTLFGGRVLKRFKLGFCPNLLFGQKSDF